MFNRYGGHRELRRELCELCPNAEAARRLVISHGIAPSPMMYVHESLLLYRLSTQYNFAGSNILEIGTALGGSAAIIASAAPLANIVTLDPNVDRSAKASKLLRHWDNVVVRNEKSWDYLSTYTSPQLNLILVDGDHAYGVWQDVSWWNWLHDGGLILFHDYSDTLLLNIHNCVNELRRLLGRQFDVYISTSIKGFVGYYHRNEDPIITLLEGPRLSTID